MWKRWFYPFSPSFGHFYAIWRHFVSFDARGTPIFFFKTFVQIIFKKLKYKEMLQRWVILWKKRFYLFFHFYVILHHFASFYAHGAPVFFLKTLLKIIFKKLKYKEMLQSWIIIWDDFTFFFLFWLFLRHFASFDACDAKNCCQFFFFCLSIPQRDILRQVICKKNEF